MPNKPLAKGNLPHATLSPHLSKDVSGVLVEIAEKTAVRLNNEPYYFTLYLECIYLYMHILSRLIFHEFGGMQRDEFIRQCVEDLTEQLKDQVEPSQLLHDLQHREQYYCRYPCLEEHGTDIGFIAHGFNNLLLEKKLPPQLVNRATLLINDGCLLLLRRLASHHLRLHTTSHR